MTLVPALPPQAPLRGSSEPTGALSAAINGVASWYCGNGSPCTRGYSPGDLVGAIDPTLGIRKGEVVTVQANGRSVRVRIVDVCACGGARIIDLTTGAFKHLAPLSAGLVRVTLLYGGTEVKPTPPPTDL